MVCIAWHEVSVALFIRLLEDILLVVFRFFDGIINGLYDFTR